MPVWVLSDLGGQYRGRAAEISNIVLNDEFYKFHEILTGDLEVHHTRRGTTSIAQVPLPQRVCARLV